MDGPPKVPARLEHRSPGRVRVRIDKSHRGNGDVERVRRHLESHSAVASVRVNPQSGSVLVEGPMTESLHSALAEILEIIEPSGPERAGEAGVEAAVALVKQVDAKLGEATDGRLSLRWIVPAAFITFGLRQAIREGLTVGAVPWYVLLYYGVDSFLKLYPHHAPKPGPQLQVVEGREL